MRVASSPFASPPTNDNVLLAFFLFSSLCDDAFTRRTTDGDGATWVHDGSYHGAVHSTIPQSTDPTGPCVLFIQARGRGGSAGTASVALFDATATVVESTARVRGASLSGVDDPHEENMPS